MKKIAALMLMGLSTSACVVSLPTVGGGGPARAQLPASLSTAESVDSVGVGGQAGSGSGPAQLCLTTSAGMWRKEIRLANGVVLASENGTRDCANVNAALTRFELVKAKTFGVMTGVGFGTLDLTGWGGGVVTINWLRD